MNNWRYKIMEFMRGRYGGDQLGLFLVITSFVLELLGNLLRIRFIYWAGVLLIILMIFRLLSRNIYKRRRENEKFLSIKNFIFGKGKGSRSNNSAKGKNAKGPVYAYYYCPSCKQQLRIPAGKGKVRVKCPKCKESFDMNT